MEHAIIDFLTGLNYSVTVVNSLDRALAEIKKRSFHLYVSDDIYPIKWGGSEHAGACFELFEAVSKIRGKRINFIIFSDEKDIAKACQKFGITHFKKHPLDRKELTKYLESI